MVKEYSLIVGRKLWRRSPIDASLLGFTRFSRFLTRRNFYIYTIEYDI